MVVQTVLHSRLDIQTSPYVGRTVLQEGAEVDAKTTTGVTALWLAAGEGRKEVAATLIARGADVNNRRTDGITAVMAAAVGGHKVWCVMCHVSCQQEGGVCAVSRWIYSLYTGLYTPTKRGPRWVEHYSLLDLVQYLPRGVCSPVEKSKSGTSYGSL